jgi:hypothetical protein
VPRAARPRGRGRAARRPPLPRCAPAPPAPPRPPARAAPRPPRPRPPPLTRPAAAATRSGRCAAAERRRGGALPL